MPSPMWERYPDMDPDDENYEPEQNVCGTGTMILLGTVACFASASALVLRVVASWKEGGSPDSYGARVGDPTSKYFSPNAPSNKNSRYLARTSPL